MSLKFASRQFEDGLRMRFTSNNTHNLGGNMHFCWTPKKDELKSWEALLNAANSCGKMCLEIPHDEYDPFIEIDVTADKVFVVSFSYEPSANFYEEEFVEEITSAEFAQIATRIIAELKALP